MATAGGDPSRAANSDRLMPVFAILRIMPSESGVSLLGMILYICIALNYSGGLKGPEAVTRFLRVKDTL